MPLPLLSLLVTGAIFFILDFAWLGTMSARLYRPELGSLMRERIALLPAIAFYVVYVTVLTWLVVLPALNSGGATRAMINGALLGLGAYATYNLTNASTLNGWPTTLTFVDWAWGTFATGATAWLSVAAITALRGEI